MKNLSIGLNKIFRGGKKAGQKLPESYLFKNDSDFRMIESYNGLRTNIMFSLTKTEKRNIILITSSVQDEGKTTISINLATNFAQAGGKVLLIDADLRKPSIHRYLGLDGSVGLTNVLCGYADITSAIQRTRIPDVDVVAAGAIPPNPTKLLASQELKDLLERLNSQYDYIFIDSPPISIVTDAALIANSCTGVAVVVREDVTELDRLDVAIKNLKKADANILGFIMLTDGRNEKRYGYSRNYGYYGNYKSDGADKPVDSVPKE